MAFAGAAFSTRSCSHQAASFEAAASFFLATYIARPPSSGLFLATSRSAAALRAARPLPTRGAAASLFVCGVRVAPHLSLISMDAQRSGFFHSVVASLRGAAQRLLFMQRSRLAQRSGDSYSPYVHGTLGRATQFINPPRAAGQLLKPIQRTARWATSYSPGPGDIIYSTFLLSSLSSPPPASSLLQARSCQSSPTTISIPHTAALPPP